MLPNSPYEQVKQALPQLSASQLKDLSNRCKALMSIEVESDDWLLEGIIHELKLRGVQVPSLVKLQKLSSFPSYTEKSLALRTTLEKQGNLTKLEKRQLAIVCSKCLIDYLKPFADISIGNMLDHIHCVPQALERSFPGYLSSHLLLFIVRSHAEND